MTMNYGKALARALLLVALACSIPSMVEAQGRGNGRGNRGGGHDGGAVVTTTASVMGVDVTLSADMRTQIADYYVAHPVSNVDALPPGIRRNLARGKPLPPGIAKKAAPAELTSRVRLRDGYELVEVGLDAFLVEVATNVVHDVLMDVVR